jgi:hypothetical protein
MCGSAIKIMTSSYNYCNKREVVRKVKDLIYTGSEIFFLA